MDEKQFNLFIFRAYKSAKLGVISLALSPKASKCLAVKNILVLLFSDIFVRNLLTR